jgi:hypothetical protein
VDIESINAEILATKILNELKYNKRMFYNWPIWFRGDKEENIREVLVSEISNIKNELLKGTLNPKLKEIEAIPMYKKVKDNLESQSHNVITFSSSRKITGKIEFNYFIQLSLQDFIVSAIWVETVGKIVDNGFDSDIYANRLSVSQSSFFKPYFDAYSEFRDSNFDKMRQWINNKETGIYIQTDLSRCYYNVSVQNIKERLLTELRKHSISDFEFITEYIFLIIEKYNNLKEVREFLVTLNNSEEKNNERIDGVLPIGFLPSNILSNLYLLELDKKIKEEFYPVNYSRYVDDIVFLIKTDISENYLSSELPEVERIKSKLSLIKSSLKNSVELNEEKTLFFIVNKQNDINYLNKFEKETQQLSSDNYRLIDPNEYDKEFENAYKLTQGLTKLSDLFTIVRDKKYISRTISTIFNYIFWNLKEDIDGDNVRLSKKFIDYFYSFVDDEFLLNLFDYWYHLIIIELISKKLLLSEYSKSLTSIKKYKLEFWNRFQLLKENVEKENDYLDVFLSHFEKNIEKVFSCKLNTPLYQIQEYFRYPRYKLENIIDETSLFYFEKQLRKLVQFKCSQSLSISSKDEDFLTIIKNNFRNNFHTVQNIKVFDNNADTKIEGYEPKDKIVLSQSNFETYSNRKNYFLSNSKNKSNITDIVITLNESDENNADVLLYPEQGIPIQEIYSLVRFSKKTKTLIIGGMDFIYLKEKEKVLNLTFIIRPFKVLKGEKEYKDVEIILLPKIYPSPLEYEKFHNSSSHLGNNWEIYIPNPTEWENQHIIEFKGSYHAILNCYEATSIDLKYEISKEEPEIVHLITNNKDIKYYYQIAESLSRDLMAVSTITNYSKFGGVEVFSPYKEEYKRQISLHKGAKNTHVDICEIDLKVIKNKRLNNLDSTMKQNPPKYYYRNLGRKYGKN